MNYVSVNLVCRDRSCKPASWQLWYALGWRIVHRFTGETPVKIFTVSTVKLLFEFTYKIFENTGENFLNNW